ncbi:MAG: TonB-dependent receptor [Acidobacteriia bacterium]|nr:TonB-dependent receptor [Terriglobia bacterium]
MSQRDLYRFLVVLMLLVGFAFQASAQEATIVGTVTDPTGATVPNASIAITNTNTGQVRQLQSNAVGEYVAPSLQIGRYTVRAQAAGFKATETKDLLLQVGDRTRIDFSLELGSASEQITVEAAPVAVQSDSSEISGYISGQQVQQIATNGRNIYLLTTLLPGVSNAMGGDFQLAVPVGGDANVSFNGLRPGHNLYMIDGGEQYDRGSGGAMSIMPSLDAIAEFRAMTSNYSAEYGLATGGVTTMVFKSGTQQLHAGAWEFVRNDALDAVNFFLHHPGDSPQKLRFNEFGFNVGGPVTLGKVYNKDKNKTFFFYNMEWRRYIQGGAPINRVVPLTGWYGGNMSGGPTITVPTAAQLAPTLLSKFTALGLQPGQPFPNNTIPTSLLDPNAQSLLKAGIFPAPTSGNAYIKGVTAPTNVREEMTRIDHHFNDKFSIFGHFVAEQISQGYVTSMWSGDNVPTIGNTFGNPSYSAVVHTIHTISPTLLNEIAFNYSGNRINIVNTGIYARPSDFNVPRLFTGPNENNRIPAINLSGATGANYTANWIPWHNKADSYQWRDDVSWAKGSHQLKMGASVLYYAKIQDLFANTQGAFTFDGTYTGNDFADYLLGLSTNYNEAGVKDQGHWNSMSYAAYIQDNWRVNKRLTLNIGLRWDGVPHTYEAENRMSNFYPNLWNPANAAVLLPNGNISPTSPGLGTSPNSILAGVPLYLNGIGIAGKNGITNGLVNDSWAAFGPRVGFAYDMAGNGKTILRAGFGMTYERVQGNDMYNAGANTPFSANVNLNNVSLSNPNLNLLTGSTAVAPIPVVSITGLNSTDYKLPVSYQYSLGVQQALGEKSVFQIAYVGNQNRHQSDREEFNLPAQSALAGLINGTAQFNNIAPYQGFGSIAMFRNAGNSHYNSLQASLNSRLAKDFTFQAAYTYSKAVDATSNNGNGWDLNDIPNPYNRSYGVGPASFNRDHVFVANFVYDIPAFRHASSHAVRTLAGGWQLAGYVTAMTGRPLNLQMSGGQANNKLPAWNGAGPGGNRPNLDGAISYPSTVASWFNTSAFSAPAIGQYGTLGYDALTGPGRHNWNLSLFKNFTLSETRGSRIEFRAEGFNVFNHTQLQNVSTTFGAGDFGKVTSAFDPRVFQLGIKAFF